MQQIERLEDKNFKWKNSEKIILRCEEVLAYFKTMDGHVTHIVLQRWHNYVNQ
jgi:hypothetical protein